MKIQAVFCGLSLLAFSGLGALACETKTPSAWYALGCKAYKEGAYAPACCLWQRACVLGGDSMVREFCARNCRCAYQKLGREETVLPWWQRISERCAHIPLLFVQLLFLVILYGTLLFVYLGRRQRITLVRGVAVALFLSGLLLMNRYFFDVQELGVVVRDQQVLYAGPGSDYPERGFLACGQTVKLCNIRDEWYKVRSSACGTGWVPRAALMSVKP